jgi:hypothetical protein
VSSDTIEPAADKREMTRERGSYDAPEIPGSRYTQSADVWSLGVTLVEMLTQQPAILPFNESVEAVIPSLVREPFLEIAKHALRRKPEARWTSAQVAERLNPSTIAVRAVAASAAARATAASGTSAVPASAIPPVPQAASVAHVASITPPAPSVAHVSPRVEPLSVPLSKEPAVPLAKQPRPAVPPAQATPPSPKPAERQTFVLPNYALPVFLIALVLVGAIVLPKMLRNRTVAQSSASPAPAPGSGKPVSDAGRLPAPLAEPPSAANPAPKPAAREEARNFTPPPAKAAETRTPAPAVMRTTDSAVPAKTRNSSDAQGRGEVLDQELPQVPSKALVTISGTVRVVVKAHVDAVGQVAGAELQESGPSRYFADKSVEAAQHWLFNSPEVNGRSVESDWLIRFEYTRGGVKAFPQQVMP